MQEPQMREQDIIECLKQLGKEVEDLGVQQPIRILMIGGAFRVTQIGKRDTTDDVDVLAYIDRSTKEYEKLLVAASYVYVDKHVKINWFSDGIGDLMQAAGTVPTGQLWLKNGMLEVYIPEPEYVLALKFLAAGRRKDIPDFQALLQRYRIKTREQAEE